MRLRTILSNVFLIAASALVTIGAVEGGTRLLDHIIPAQARSWEEFHLRKPPPYQGAPYDVEWLVNEGKSVKSRASPDFGWLPEDHSGVYINIWNHERRTFPRVESPSRRAWIFGGSTVIGAQVPDALTIPSFLQRGLPDTEVHNLGATTVSAKHQLYKLENMTAAAAGDIVVFYDGANDVIQSLYYQNPLGTMIDENHKAIESLSAHEKAIWYLYHNLKDYSAFARRFLNPVKPVYYQVSITDSMLEQLEEHYLSILKRADAFARARSMTFFHFLQPTLYTVSRHTEYETALAANGWLYPQNLREVYAAGYPALRRASQRANALGINSADLSSALDGRQREVFLDYCHITEHGNELVANAMLAQIKSLISRRIESRSSN